MSQEKLDKTFKYSRFKVEIIPEHAHAIHENVKVVWPDYILILTKLVYLAAEEHELGHLPEMFKT